MTVRAIAAISIVGGLALAPVGIGAGATQFMPPAGYSDGQRRPGEPLRPSVITPAEPNAPTLTRVPDASLSDLFRIDPSYRRAARAQAKVVGAFEVAEPAGVHLTAAWAAGFLPVLLTFSDGRCFRLSADYEGGTLFNGRLNRVSCEHRIITESAPTPAPPNLSLRLVGTSWSYAAWVDDRAGTTIITTPYRNTLEPLFTARMVGSSIAAMSGPDWPGGNVTLVGRVGNRLVVVTLEVNY